MERKTAQRAAILGALKAAARPLSPQELLHLATPHVPGLGIATVYRALKAYSESGDIVAVDIPGGGARYEVAGKPHHHHFHCQECGRVFEVEGCPGNIPALLPEGFLLRSHELILFGLCRDCTRSAKAAKKTKRRA